MAEVCEDAAKVVLRCDCVDDVTSASRELPGAKTGCFVAGTPVVSQHLNSGELIDAMDAGGNTALWHGCNDGAVEYIRFLVDHGADVNSKNGDGYTPLDRIPGPCFEAREFLRSKGAKLSRELL